MEDNQDNLSWLVKRLCDVQIPQEIENLYQVEEKLWTINSENISEILEFVQTIPNISPEFILYTLNNVTFRRSKLMKPAIDFLKLYGKIRMNFLELHDDFIFSLRQTDTLVDKHWPASPNFSALTVFTPGSPAYFTMLDDLPELINYLQAHPDYDINHRINYDFDILCLIDIAAKFGSLNCFKYLAVNNGRKDELLLNYAYEGGNEEIIQMLHIDYQATSKCFQTCILCHHNNIADRLIFLDENLISRNISISKILDSSNLRAAIFYIENGYNINEKFQRGMSCYKPFYSPLSIACEMNQLNFVEYLVSKGADIKLSSAPDPDINVAVPLHMAIGANSKKIIKYLLKNGADIDQLYLDQSPVSFALCAVENTQIMKLLVNLGANLNLVLPDNRTVLIYATQHQNCEAIKYLVKHGADINYEMDLIGFHRYNKACALRIALAYEAYEVAKLLKELGTDLGLLEEREIKKLTQKCSRGKPKNKQKRKTK